MFHKNREAATPLAVRSKILRFVDKATGAETLVNGEIFHRTRFTREVPNADNVASA